MGESSKLLPKLEITLHENGVITDGQYGLKDFYRHIKVTNKRGWAVAKNVAVMCTAIEKQIADGSFKPISWIVPLQLAWTGPPGEHSPNIPQVKPCDLGVASENGDKFRLCLYFPHPMAYIGAGEAMRVSLKVFADNFESRRPYILDIFWDGKWSADLVEMEKHLVMKEV